MNYRGVPAVKKTLFLASALVTLLLPLSCAGARAQGNTVLPTDVVPIPTQPGAQPLGQKLDMRLWQKLPAPFYFTGSVESTFRLETNPFQFPMKRTILHREIPEGETFNDLDPSDQQSILQELHQSDNFDNIYRINPNLTAGWAITPTIQAYVNYFLIRDSLMHNSVLNSNTQSIGPGIQKTISLGHKVMVQPQIMGRMLYQTHMPPVWDWLPALTAQYQVTPNLATFVNAVLQVRQLDNIGGPMRELDSFYTTGAFYQRGSWAFAVSGTYLWNVRKPFGTNALIPVNNDTIVLDFEIDKQLFKTVPGLVALVRAEPVYNFGSHDTPGLAGVDFRFYYGLRMALAKPPLTGTIEQLRKRYMHKEEPPPPAESQSGKDNVSQCDQPPDCIANGPIHQPYPLPSDNFAN